MDIGLKIIFFNFTLMTVHRDTLFIMYAHMTTRSYRRYIHLFYMIISSHKRSIKATGCHQRSHINTIQEPIFCMYIQITTRRYIRNIKLTTNIIKGNCRPQMVTCQKLVFTRVLTFLFLITNLPLTPINTFLHVH